MRGRRTPTAIKKLQGSFNVTREVKNPVEYKGISGLPEPPEILNEFGQSLWFRHGKQLSITGLLNETNLWALEGFCFSCQIARDAAKTAMTDGKSLRKWRMAMDVSSQYGAKFGFDPQSVTKIVGVNKKEEPKKSAYMQAIEGTLRVAK